MELKWIHIVAALLALAAGAIALAARKGSPWHRRSGRVFVGSMLVMTVSAELMALFVHPNRLNVVAAGLTFYLVCTGWLSVRQTVEQSRHWLIALMLLGLLVGVFAFTAGIEAINNGSGRVDGMPPEPIFVFGSIALSAALLDARLLRAGSIQGAHRLVRHLWRIGLAMLIATMSLFFGQARLFPQALRESGLLSLPILLVAAMLLYWLLRLLLKRRSSLPRQHGLA